MGIDRLHYHLECNTAENTRSLSHFTRIEDKRTCARNYWRKELQSILRIHEPAQEQHADSMLDTYEGMERELVQCYRHFYTGEGGFCIAVNQSTTTTFSLPREAIDTYLRVKLCSRRHLSFTSKADGVREPEAPLPTRSSPRQRAASAS